MIGVGFWNPVKSDLDRVRKEWSIDAVDIREILADKVLIKIWNGMKGEKLKSAPTGYSKDHPNIDLINYKQWLFTHSFTDEEVLSKDFSMHINENFKLIRPFLDYMSNVLTTDLDGVSII